MGGFTKTYYSVAGATTPGGRRERRRWCDDEADRERSKLGQLASPPMRGRRDGVTSTPTEARETEIGKSAGSEPSSPHETDETQPCSQWLL